MHQSFKDFCVVRQHRYWAITVADGRITRFKQRLTRVTLRTSGKLQVQNTHLSTLLTRVLL